MSFEEWNLTFCGVLGATSRAERPLSIPEFPHIHVRLILVPHPLPHLPPSACRHAHLWYFHVWGRTLSKHVFVSVRCLWDLLMKCMTLSVGPRDHLPGGPGHPAVQSDRPHSAGHGGHVAGKKLVAGMGFMSQPQVKCFTLHILLRTWASWRPDLLHSVAWIKSWNHWWLNADRNKKGES